MATHTARKDIALLALAIGVGLALRLYFVTGLIASDDLTHAYAAHHLFEDPDEHLIGSGGADAYSVNGRRIGVNLPMWMSIRAFGVSEWSLALVPLVFSLAGIFVMFALVRRLAGTNAGLLAAWLWACLPGDVYSATIFLQDNIFATVLALALYFAAASEPAARERAADDDDTDDDDADATRRAARRRMAAACAAGFAVGYTQYLKGNGFLVFGAFAGWHVWASLWARRLDRRLLWLTAGFVAAQLCAAIYFWAIVGDPLHFWRLQFSRLSVLTGSYEPANPFPNNLFALWRYVTRDWVFGYAVALFPAFALAALAVRRAPMRMLWLLLAGAQLVAMLGAMSWAVWTQRYVLQISPLFIALTAVGARALATPAAGLPITDRALRRLRAALPAANSPARDARIRAVAAAAGAGALVAATALALAHDRQQHGRWRAEVVRDAYSYLEATAGDDEPIYVDGSDRVPTYTRRALALLAGFQPFKGGFRPLEDAYEATGGWVVITHLEKRHTRLRDQPAFRGVADHWLEVFRSQNRGGRYFARVFRVLPGPVPDGVAVIGTYLFPARQPDLSDLELTRPAFDQPPARYRSGRESAVAAVDIAITRGADAGQPPDAPPTPADSPIPETDVIACEVTAESGPGHHFGGVALDVPGLSAVRFHLAFSDPSDIESFVVYAEDATGKRLARWQLALRRSEWDKGWEGDVALVPGAPSGYFRLTGHDLAPADIARLHFLLRVRAGRTAGFALRRLEIATP